MANAITNPPTVFPCRRLRRCFLSYAVGINSLDYVTLCNYIVAVDAQSSSIMIAPSPPSSIRTDSSFSVFPFLGACDDVSVFSDRLRLRFMPAGEMSVAM